MTWKEECSKHLGAMDRTEQEHMFAMLSTMEELLRSSNPMDMDWILQAMWDQIKEQCARTT